MGASMQKTKRKDGKGSDLVIRMCTYGVTKGRETERCVSMQPGSVWCL